MKNVKILFEAVGKMEDVNKICKNFYEGYPEFSSNMEEEDFKYNESTNEFSILWVGEFEDDELDEHDVNELIRLTHHAEGFYEDTNVEYVHVEVCIDGKWYGRKGE